MTHHLDEQRATLLLEIVESAPLSILLELLAAVLTETAIRTGAAELRTIATGMFNDPEYDVRVEAAQAERALAQTGSRLDEGGDDVIS